MPCYNEEGVIERVVRAYYNEIIAKENDAEFIVINDCSSDATEKIIERLAAELPRLKILKTPHNSGHGKALRLGYEAASKRYVFQADSDNQFDPAQFWKLYEYRETYDLVLGFRQCRQDPFHRLILSKIIACVNFLLFGVVIRDANCPFRLIDNDKLQAMLKIIDRQALAPNIMISILAKKKNMKVKEIPLIHYPRKTGTVSLASWRLIRFSLRGLKQLLEFKTAINSSPASL